MFSFLKKSIRRVVTDKVWMSMPECVEGMVKLIQSIVEKGEVPVIFFFFERDANFFTTHLDNAKIPWANPIGAAKGKTLIVPVFGSDWGSGTAGLESAARNSKLTLIFRSHYPLPKKEDAMLEKMESTLGVQALIFCSSFGDPLYQYFKLDIKALMDLMGLKKGECIEHPLVSRALIGAREKIEKSILAEASASSELEWFQKNAPPK